MVPAMIPTSRVSEDRMRETFEKWAVANDYYMDIRRDGNYASTATSGAWAGFQAALSTMGDVVAVSELRDLADSWESVTRAFDRPDSSYTHEKIVGHRRALTADLSAILNRGGK